MAAPQKWWAARTVEERLVFLRRARLAMAAAAERFLPALEHLPRNGADSLTAEVLPLLDAMRFLEREGTSILKLRRLGVHGRPLWLSGVQATIRREPLGHVLVIGPANFPLFLPGAQAMQALAAGNAVTWKPGGGGSAAATLVAEFLREAGLPDGVLRIIGEELDDVEAALAERPDKVVFTGSRETGQRVLSRLAGSVTPAVMELSGCDAVVVLPSAKARPGLETVARAVAFGLRLNGGQVCMSPRRLVADRATLDLLRPMLVKELAAVTAVTLNEHVAAELQACVREAVRDGARLVDGSTVAPGAQRPLLVEGVRPIMRIAQVDLFAPVLSLIEIPGSLHAYEVVNACPFGLTAAIFGNETEAEALSPTLRVGTVLINDLIAPTADPRVPFGGHGDSGYGSTRGAEGLLEMTALRTVLVRRRGSMRHLEHTQEADVPLLAEMIRSLHAGSWAGRVQAIRRFVSRARDRRH